LERILGNVTGTPLHRIQGFEVSLETKFSGAARQANPFQRGLKKIAIHVVLVAISFLSNGARDDTSTGTDTSTDSGSGVGEGSRVRKPVAERITWRRTTDFGRQLLLVNLTLHVTAVVRIRWVVMILILMLMLVLMLMLMEQRRRQGIKMITHSSNFERCCETMLQLCIVVRRKTHPYTNTQNTLCIVGL